ncbi:MAG: hypothetical protein Q8N96_12775 [Methylovulum sp.]|nr:hypothetical protein [Methylovulum sp.]
MTKNNISLALAVFSSFGAMTVAAMDFSLPGADVSLSGFATAGFAISDQPYNYPRFLNNKGTFKRDSIAGAQVDVKLNNGFSITAQAKIAPSISSDDDIGPTLTWAFLSWRPTNDLLFRGGRLRVPLYLNSQNKDIGTTFDFARLPTEVYSTAPTTDFDGLAASKTWDFDAGELTLDGYIGMTDIHLRKAPFNFAPISSDSVYVPYHMEAYGLALTFQQDDNLFRISAHDSYTQCTTCAKGENPPVTFPFVALMPGVGYYQISNQMPGPGVPDAKIVHTPVYTVAADVALGYGFRIMGEYVRRNVRNIATSLDSQGGYLAVLKSFGDWTPYVSVAHLQSTDRTLDLYNRLKNNTVPDFIPNAAFINASQRAGAARIFAFDQTTWAVGTSYRINATSKLKAEWAVTKIGDASSFVDTPAGEDSGNRLINVFSFSYNMVF